MIYFVPHEHESITVKEILLRNDIEWQIYDEWDFSTRHQFVIPKHGLVIFPWHCLDDLQDVGAFADAVRNSDCKFYFCEKMDTLARYLGNHKYFTDCDNVFYHVDGIPHKPDSKIVTVAEFDHLLNIELPIRTNFTRNYDFVTFQMLTEKKNEHRAKLVDLLQDNDLLDNAFTNIVYNSNPDDKQRNQYAKETRQGYTRNLEFNGFSHGPHVPWDIYDQCYMEVATETYYEHATMFVASTTRSIVYGFPSLVLSDENYYSRFKQLGFETWDRWLYESWHDANDLDVRVSGLVENLMQIKDIGFDNFYNLAKPVCEHNYYNLVRVKHQQKLQHHNQFLDFLENEDILGN